MLTQDWEKDFFNMTRMDIINIKNTEIQSWTDAGSFCRDLYLQKDMDAVERVQRRALRFITGNYKSATPGAIHKLQQQLKLPTLQDLRKAIRLTFMYKVVEGLVLTMPPEKFIKHQRSKRLIWPRKDQNFTYQNTTVGNLTSNNTKCFVLHVLETSTEQFKNSFFIKTAAEWNRLKDQTVQAKSIDSFKSSLIKEMNIIEENI